MADRRSAGYDLFVEGDVPTEERRPDAAVTRVWEGDRERSRIAALMRYGILDTPPDPRFDRVAQLAAAMFDVPMTIVTLVAEQRQWFKARVGLTLPETARAISFCNSTLELGAINVVEDPLRHPDFADNPLVTGPPYVRFYAGSPLITPDGFPIGTVVLLDTRPRTLDARQRGLLDALAAIAVDELEMWRRLGSAEDRERTTRELNERRFAALLEHAPDIIVVTDAQGRIRYASPALERTIGWRGEEVLGRDVFELIVHPDDVEAARRDLAALLADPSTRIEFERRIRHRDGSWRVVEASAQNLLADPAIDGIVFNARDITRRREAEAADARARTELRRASEQLRQSEKLEAIGRVAGGIAHDFNNVLTVVLNAATVARAELPPGSPALAEIDQITRAGERAAELTSQILAFSRRQVLTRGSADPRQVVTDVLRLLRPLLGHRVDVDVTCAPDVGDIDVDRAQLERVLLNLLVNARDAMPNGGQIRIDVRRGEPPRDRGAPPDARYAVLTIEDTGDGISPDVLEHVFEPFFTTKPAGQGNGLGLSIVHGIVEQHGGFVDVESAPGAGARFHVYLPERRAPAAVERDRSRSVAPVGAGETVLVAEDDELVRATTTTTLRRAGYQVIEASDGEQAVARFAERPGQIALVVLDAKMPRLGGADALERIRALRPDVRYLLCSGYPEALPGVDARAWLGKPYRREELLARVAERLG
jgi:PAS domain S-box-containing protein